MTLGEIDYSLQPQLPELWLAKPDRTIIAKLNNRTGVGSVAYGKKSKFLKHNQLYKLNNINELEFSIPFQVDVDHRLVRNSVVDQIVESSLIKSIHNGIEEWFTIVGIKKNMNDGSDNMTVTCRSLGYELIYRYVRNYKVVSANLSSLLNGGTTVDGKGNNVAFPGLLQGTAWQLDPGFDATFDTIYRTLEVSKSTVLDALVQIAKTFNAIVVWDTVKRRINFQKLTNIGQDQGLKISYKNYMKSLENDSKVDIIVTRFIPYGKNGLTINSVNVNGTNYIDDFSFFINGYTRDSNKNVLTHSPHMSDSLCGALLDYQELLQSKNGNYATLLTSLTAYQTQKTSKENDLKQLNTTLVTIHKQIDIAQSTSQDASSLLIQQANLLSSIASKQAEIDLIINNISATNNQILALQTILSTNANFTQDQQKELSYFIREADWLDSNISDAQSLYNQALIQFQKSKSPQIMIKVDIVNLFESIEEQLNWQKVAIGNTVLVEYDVLGTSVKAKIIEMSFDHVEGSLTLTIASVADLLREEEAIYKMIYQGISAANTLSVNLDSWNSIDAVARNVNAIYNNGIDSAKIAINGGTSNTIVINNRGLTSTTSTDANSLIRLNNGTLGFSGDGGNTYAVAIDKTGIYANRLVGQVIAGSQLTISNQSGTFSMNGNGVTIAGAALTITNGLPESQINGSSVSKWNLSEVNAKTYTDAQLISINTTINEFSNDGKLTGFEKQQVKQQWDGIVAEKPTIEAQGTAYGITSEKTNYVVAYDALNVYLAPLLTNLTTTSDIDGVVFRQKFTEYLNRRQLLIKAISDKAVQIGAVYNGVVIDTTNGLTVARSNSTLRTRLNATEGITIAKNTGTPQSPAWSNVFFADDSGNLNITGNITANSGTFNGVVKATDFLIGGTSVLSGNQISGSYINAKGIIVTNNAGQNTFKVDGNGNVILSGAINWSQTNSDPTIATAQNAANNAQSTASVASSIAQQIVAGTYTGGTFIDGKNVISANIVGAMITGGSITSDTNINVNKDINVGAYVKLNGSISADQGILFAGNGSITFKSSGTLELGARNAVNFSLPSVMIQGDQIATQRWVNINSIAKFG